MGFCFESGHEKGGVDAKFGLVHVLGQAESARSPPNCLQQRHNQATQTAGFSACRVQTASGPTGESSQPAAGQPSTRWGWRLSGSMDGLQRWEFVAEELEKLQRGAMPFEVEYRLS